MESPENCREADDSCRTLVSGRSVVAHAPVRWRIVPHGEMMHGANTFRFADDRHIGVYFWRDAFEVAGYVAHVDRSHDDRRGRCLH
jgi:hypothetical protein